MKFPVIVADPPWHFECWSDHAVATSRNGPARKAAKANGRLASAHYSVRGTSWIQSLPVPDIAEDDCTLLLWAVWPMLPDALRVIEAWGFEYKTLGFDWVKTTQAGTPAWGMGYWTRANSEPCLLATRGKPKRLDKGISQVLACGTGRHSEKPFEFYERTERLLAGPYLEMFARPHGDLLDGARPGWTRVGNEITGRDMADDLRLLAELPQPSMLCEQPEEASTEAQGDLFA